MSKIDFEGNHWTDVNPTAEPLKDPQTGEVVTEPYEKNPDVKLEFGILNGQVVIRRIETPNFYPQEQANEMADYGKKNIGNCPICEKHKHFLEDMKKKLPLKVERSFDTWVVDVRPDEKVRVRKIMTNDNDPKDVAVGVGFDKDKQIVAKKLAFPIEKYSKDEALRLAEEYRQDAVGHVEKLKEDVQKRIPTKTVYQKSTYIPISQRKSDEPKSNRARIGVGLFPNITDWRKDRKRIVD